MVYLNVKQKIRNTVLLGKQDEKKTSNFFDVYVLHIKVLLVFQSVLYAMYKKDYLQQSFTFSITVS